MRSQLFRAGKDKREIAALRSPLCVIARHEAISPVTFSCHREGRGDLAFLQPANRKKRDCRAALAMTNTPVIARNVAISVVQSWQRQKRDCRATLATPRGGSDKKNRAALASMCHREARGDLACHLFLSSRGTWRSRFSTASKQKKERLLRKLAMTNAPVIARNEAISPFHNLQTEKREIASQARNPAKGR